MPVIVYTLPNCQPCKMTKRQLSKGGIEYEERNLMEYEEEKDHFAAEGYLQAPIVVTEGETWSGFRIDKVKTLIKSREEVMVA